MFSKSFVELRLFDLENVKLHRKQEIPISMDFGKNKKKLKILYKLEAILKFKHYKQYWKNTFVI